MHKPVLQALVLADFIYHDRATNKKTIIGTFNTLKFRKLHRALLKPQPESDEADSKPPGAEEQGPSKESPSETVAAKDGITLDWHWVYINLTDLRCESEFQLRYVDLKTNKALMYTHPRPISTDDPLRSLEIISPVHPLPVPHPGVYALEFLVNDHLLGSLRVMAVEDDSETSS